jgi:tRNA G18 (ribose-2'-O)-methylase SpoU
VARNFLTWGIHCVRSALEHAPHDALELWIKDSDPSRELVGIKTLSESIGLVVQIVPPKTLARLSEDAVNQGVVLRRRAPTPLALDAYISGLP